MAPDSLVVEITERRELASLEAARAVVAALEALGVRVAIDDAGTGHNGLAAIKGPRSGDAEDRQAVSSTGSTPTSAAARWRRCWCRSRASSTWAFVAEGVERPEQAAALLAIGVRGPRATCSGRRRARGLRAEAATEGRGCPDATRCRVPSRWM